ncbi:CPBP family intramembrane metalloprotease [Halolamina sp. CBA1230]|uniref:CPBP family intramembrane glutamic endopeptidase n=1 Tax=Halolamina sp. CBA1230 TaxID=1853690 RepID=UPI0009A1C527|nr:CPBP family intramembrane glutamic endopeptidase [Halolamina sp. CBA1230]QKY20300.1 CPBP family intramembrane metalloprotease [Halolamina sp. CBA1230]
MDSRLRAIGVGVGLGIAGIGVALVLVLLSALTLSFAGVTITPVLSIVLSLLLTQGVAFLGVGALYLRERGIPVRSIGVRLPSIKEFGIVIGALVLSFVYLIAVSQLLSATGTEAAENQVSSLAMENPEIVLYLLPGSFLLIGPGEELLFRGVVQNRIREAFSPVPGVVIASVIFAAIHVGSLVATDPSAVLVSVGVLMGPSLILGGIYEYTRNLVVPIIVHGTYNALIFLSLYLVATGAVEESGNAAAAVVAALP